jgi:imidazolonepropionase-like amidohydrolase
LGSGGMVPGESLHDELALLVVAGYSPAEALRAATLNPATFLGAADSMGKAESGYVADLVILEGNPLSDIRNTRRIAAVIRAGVVVSR